MTLITTATNLITIAMFGIVLLSGFVLGWKAVVSGPERPWYGLWGALAILLFFLGIASLFSFLALPMLATYWAMHHLPVEGWLAVTAIGAFYLGGASAEGDFMPTDW